MKLRRFLTAKSLFVVLLVALFSLLTYVTTSEKTYYVYIDGNKTAVTSTQKDPEKLVENVMEEIAVNDYIIVDYVENNMAVDNSEIYVQTRKDLVLEVVNEVKEVSTYALDVQELLIENKLYTESDDQRYIVVNKNEEEILVDGEYLKVIFEEEVKIEAEYIDSQEEKIVYIDTLDLNVKVVANEGQPEIKNVVYNVLLQNGMEVEREVIATTVVQKAVTKEVHVGTKRKVVNTNITVDNASVWDQLAKCESSGNWSINTGNGYYGGLQFSASTWSKAASAVGIDVSHAHLATKEQQIAAASWVQKHSGWRAWGSCSKKLGLY